MNTVYVIKKRNSESSYFDKYWAGESGKWADNFDEAVKFFDPESALLVGDMPMSAFVAAIVVPDVVTYAVRSRMKKSYNKSWAVIWDGDSPHGYDFWTGDAEGTFTPNLHEALMFDTKEDAEGTASDTIKHDVITRAVKVEAHNDARAAVMRP